MLERILRIIPFYKKSQDSLKQIKLYEELLADSQTKLALLGKEAKSSREIAEEKGRMISLLQRDVAKYTELSKKSEEASSWYATILKERDKKIASLEEDAKKYIALIYERDSTIFFQEQQIKGDEALLRGNSVKIASLEKRVSALDSLASHLKKKVNCYERDYFLNKAIVQSVDESSVPVLVAQPEDYIIVYANLAAGKLMEYDHMNLKGMNFFSLFSQSGLEAEFSTAIKEAPFEKKLKIGKRALRGYVSVFKSDEKCLIAIRMEEMGAVDKKLEQARELYAQAKEIASGAGSAIQKLLEKHPRTEPKLEPDSS